MRLFTMLLLASALACGPSSGPTPPEPPFGVPKGPLRAAAAVRLIELPVGHPHAGYTQTPALAGALPPDEPGSPFAAMFPATRGIESAPTARALVLDNGHDRLAIARIDAIFTTFEVTQAVIDAVRERYGVDLTGRLLLNATHTHAAGCRFSSRSMESSVIALRPEDERHAMAHGCDTFSEESLARVAGPLADAIGEALARLTPARIGWAFGENTTAARDRRCENDYLYGPGDHDTRVGVVRVDDAGSGAPIAVLFNYAMHGTISGADNRSLSVDAPGHAEIALEDGFEAPVVAMYLQGAAGDVSPAGDVRGHEASQAMARAGWDLARTVREVHAGIVTRGEVALRGVDRIIPLEYDLLGYARGEFAPDGAMLCLTEGACDASAPSETASVVCAGEALEDGGKYATWIGAARIDTLHLLAVPGEATTELGRRALEAARAAGAEEAMLLGYAMDHNGYILTEEDWLSGGYEPTISYWGWRFGPYLVDQLASLVSELRTGEAEGALVAPPLELGPALGAPVTPTGSNPAPAFEGPLPATTPRLSELRVAFLGGDPVLGHPEVIVEAQTAPGTFEPLTRNGWRKVTSLVGGGVRLSYAATPTHAQAPGATLRRHRWEAIWTPGRDVPAGVHRLRVRGRHWVGGASQTYELVSTPTDLVPAALAVRGAVSATPAGPVAHLVLLYPAAPPTRAALEGSTGWQIGGFGMVDPDFAPPFVPVRDGVARGDLEVIADGASPVTRRPAFEALAFDPARRSYDPGEGPGFQMSLPPGVSWQVTLPEGALGDPAGNGNAATRLDLVLE